jgi:putative ubiquitin-RnfH superfamily antitoxin RatB of RatAB toxin-antitoxin module
VSAERRGSRWLAGAAEPLHVELIHSPAPRVVESCALTLPAGATVADALRAAALPAAVQAAVAGGELSVSVWGRLQPLTHPLREGDRIELCRALAVDPKEARRLRYKGRRTKAPARG